MIGAAKRVLGVFWEFIEAVVFALAIFVIIYLFLFQPNQVKGSSMATTFEDNEYILTDKISYRLNNPQRGDVIVFKSPRNQEVDFIKRIIGLPGDRIRIWGGRVYLNGQLLDEPYLSPGTVTSSGLFAREGLTITVPPGEYFVMGDNRSHSSDSREWGTVTRDEFIGKVFFRYFPFTRFGPIPN